MSNYPGGKAGSGVYQFIINQIPPHKVYIEGFLGGGAVLKRKKPAEHNIGIDRDHEVITGFQEAPEYRYHREDGCHFYFFTIGFLNFLKRIDKDGYDGPQRFIYLDPPYLIRTRKQQKPIYKFEMTDEEHEQLLAAIKDRPEKIMISGYYSDLYARQLAGWRCKTLRTITRGGTPALEHFWMNYPEPTRLHDYGYLGVDFTDRQRIKRKIQRLKSKLAALPALERAAILEAFDDIDNSDYSGLDR